MKFRCYKIYLILLSLSFVFSNTDRQTIDNEKYKFVQEIYSDSWALIIGINKYQNVEPLTYAVSDAKSVKELLVSKYGFKNENVALVLDEDATKENILDAFSDILTKAKDKDRVVVFYAGHGETYKLPSGGDMGYLIPVDGNLDNLYRSSIPMKSIYEIAEMSYAKHILYLVDACYGGLTLNTRGLKKDTTPEYLKKMTKERGRQVITAGGKDEQVIEKPEWGHSAFTRNLLKGLGDDLADGNDDGIITADELGSFLRNRVPIDSDGAHTPQRGRIGSDMGEFVFISEILEESLAESYPENKKMNEMEEKMAALEQMMLNQQQGQNTPGIKKSRVKKSISPNIASKRAWVFPGMGHLYLGKQGKGYMFAGLEIMSLAGVAVFSSIYSTNTNEMNIAQANFTKLQEDLKDPEKQISSDDLELENSNYINAKSAKQAAMNGLIGCATSAAIIWLWNLRDIKKNTSSEYSNSETVNMDISPQGEISIRFLF